MLLVATAVAGQIGDRPAGRAPGGRRTVWILLALALDALAIAAQALTGTRSAPATWPRCAEPPGAWCAGDGWPGRLGAVVLLRRARAAGVAVHGDDPAVRDGDRRRRAGGRRRSQPLAGYVFVLDGVLIGAGRRALPGLGERGAAASRSCRWPLAVAMAGPDGTAGLVLAVAGVRRRSWHPRGAARAARPRRRLAGHRRRSAEPRHGRTWPVPAGPYRDAARDRAKRGSGSVSRRRPGDGHRGADVGVQPDVHRVVAERLDRLRPARPCAGRPAARRRP